MKNIGIVALTATVATIGLGYIQDLVDFPMLNVCTIKESIIVVVMCQ